MNILIASDMEGVTGVVIWEQVTSGQADYERFRRLMTLDVNAAVQGAFDAGATKVTVTDGHANGTNLLLEELDERVRLNCGSPSPLSMVQGLADVDGVLFIGYHARAGAENAVLAHTWSSRTVANLWLNDQVVGEYGLNAAVAGHFDVPVLMISGDQTACAQAVELLGPLEVAVVKQASGFSSAECLPPAVTGVLIREAARRAVERLKAGSAPMPFQVEKPVRVAVDWLQPAMADRAALLPGAHRRGLRVEFIARDMLEAYTWFRSAVAFASVG
jgi:D-amino peptidase